MYIQLDKDFRMTSDPKNLVLEKRSEIRDKDGKFVKEIWVNDGNYTHLNGLLKGYMKKSIYKSAAEVLGELAEDVKRIEGKIDKFTEGQAKGENINAKKI